MTQLIVMEKDSGRMNVPPAKLQEFLEAGWVEVERVDMTSDTKPAEAAPKADKPKSKKAGKADEPAEADED